MDEGGLRENEFWCPHQESNLDLSLRRRLFYPLNYEDGYQRGILAGT